MDQFRFKHTLGVVWVVDGRMGITRRRYIMLPTDEAGSGGKGKKKEDW